jgi:hypothetical protein
MFFYYPISLRRNDYLIDNYNYKKTNLALRIHQVENMDEILTF